jgi:hypothetical protein
MNNRNWGGEGIKDYVLWGKGEFERQVEEGGT